MARGINGADAAAPMLDRGIALPAGTRTTGWREIRTSTYAGLLLLPPSHFICVAVGSAIHIDVLSSSWLVLFAAFEEADPEAGGGGVRLRTFPGGARPRDRCRGSLLFRPRDIDRPLALDADFSASASSAACWRFILATQSGSFLGRFQSGLR